jgi:hypothetical protein
MWYLLAEEQGYPEQRVPRERLTAQELQQVEKRALDWKRERGLESDPE